MADDSNQAFVCVNMAGWQQLQTELSSMRAELDALKAASQPAAPAAASEATPATPAVAPVVGQ